MKATHITIPARLLMGAMALMMASALMTRACAAQASAPAAAQQGTVIDQVVAVVNGDLVLESDVDEEQRLQAFQLFRDESQSSREKTIERLVDRTLILQQEKLQPQPPITDAEVNEQLLVVRKDIPACKEYKCETDAGWQRFVADQGFALPELMERWRSRMEVLRFIEQRFRMGIRISADEIRTYYEKTLLPEYAKRNATAPKLAVISDRIQEILLQRQVGALLDDWLESLKAQGTVRMTRPRQVAP